MVSPSVGSNLPSCVPSLRLIPCIPQRRQLYQSCRKLRSRSQRSASAFLLQVPQRAAPCSGRLHWEIRMRLVTFSAKITIPQRRLHQACLEIRLHRLEPFKHLYFLAETRALVGGRKLLHYSVEAKPVEGSLLEILARALATIQRVALPAPGSALGRSRQSLNKIAAMPR